MSTYIAAMALHNLLYNRQTQPDALTIHFCCSLQLSELLEKVWQVFLIDADSSVFNLDHESASRKIIPGSDFNLAFFSEFQSILE